MRNLGKMFEEDIMDSVPRKLFKYKLRDSASGWSGGNKARFTTTNICDIQCFDGQWFHLWELKSHKGNSIPTSPKHNEKGKITHYGVIKKNQLDGLIEAYSKKNVEPGFLFNFSDKQKTYFVSVKWVAKALLEENKKSLNLEWVEQHGTLIPQELKGRSKMHWIYDLSILLDNVRKEKTV